MTGRLAGLRRRRRSFMPRRHEHPVRHLQNLTRILQADTYCGYNALYDPSRTPGAVVPAWCWAHPRRQFFELADIVAHA